jgi:uncharacterized cofD-like protein
MAKKKPKVVVIGGGTGTYTVLSGLKHHPLDITAVVSMADSGGSAKKERDEWGMLPVSDVRKALLALSSEEGQEGLIRELLNYRFTKGVGVEGTTFGNLFLVALSNILGSQEKAIEELGKILEVKGRVLPVTLEQTNLVAEYDEGVTVVGEHEIDEPKHDGRLSIRRVYLLPSAKAHPPALKAIKEADLIVIGPGDLYTSIIPVLIVEGVSKALKKSRAKKAFVLNLMNRYGQTSGFTASRFLKVLEGYLEGLKFDHILVNNAPLPKEVLRHYALKEKGYPVDDDLGDESGVIRGNFLSRRVVKPQPGDKLRRSLLRHDPANLAKAVIGLLGGQLTFAE